jgi:hypothetical protein
LKSFIPLLATSLPRPPRGPTAGFVMGPCILRGSCSRARQEKPLLANNCHSDVEYLHHSCHDSSMSQRSPKRHVTGYSSQLGSTRRGSPRHAKARQDLHPRQAGEPRAWHCAPSDGGAQKEAKGTFRLPSTRTTPACFSRFRCASFAAGLAHGPKLLLCTFPADFAWSLLGRRGDPDPLYSTRLGRNQEPALVQPAASLVRGLGIPAETLESINLAAAPVPPSWLPTPPRSVLPPLLAAPGQDLLWCTPAVIVLR